MEKKPIVKQGKIKKKHQNSKKLRNKFSNNNNKQTKEIQKTKRAVVNSYIAIKI